MKLRMTLIALALILVISVVPCTAKGPKDNYGGDVYRYAFGTPVMDDDSINLCWELDASQPDGVSQDAEKFSVVLFGDLSYSFGTVEPYTVVEDAEVSIDYSTTETCIAIDLGMVEAEVLATIAASEGIAVEEIQNFTFDISAKVKGLDPHNKASVKRQDNWFSPPVEVGTLEWSAETLPTD
jgi:hypothetical protein